MEKEFTFGKGGWGRFIIENRYCPFSYVTDVADDVLEAARNWMRTGNAQIWFDGEPEVSGIIFNQKNAILAYDDEVPKVYFLETGAAEILKTMVESVLNEEESINYSYYEIEPGARNAKRKRMMAEATTLLDRLRKSGNKQKWSKKNKRKSFKTSWNLDRKKKFSITLEKFLLNVDSTELRPDDMQQFTEGFIHTASNWKKSGKSYMFFQSTDFRDNFCDTFCGFIFNGENAIFVHYDELYPSAVALDESSSEVIRKILNAVLEKSANGDLLLRDSFQTEEEYQKTSAKVYEQVLTLSKEMNR